MVYVRLAREWIDPTGVSHAGGDMVDVDVATLAALEQHGVVTAPAEPEPAVPEPAVPDPAVPDPAVPDPAVPEPAEPPP